MTFLVTGAGSGLGRAAWERFGGHALTRENARGLLKRLSRGGVTTVIHCAADVVPEAAEADMPRFVEDNILLTERLTRLPHRAFVFVSTADVYPPGAPGREDEPIPAVRARSLYAAAKLMSEAVARSRARRPLILRPTALLGRRARHGTLVRLARGRADLRLAARSRINCVLHDDVLDFVALALRRGLGGVYNAASSAAVTVAAAARLAGVRPRYGRFLYDAGRVDNRRIAALVPAFRRTSRQAFRAFLSAGAA